MDDQMLPMQRIEGGGPPKKMDWGTMPKPLRIFGYTFFACMIVMLLATIFVSLFK